MSHDPIECTRPRTAFFLRLGALTALVVGLAIALGYSDVKIHGDGWEYYQTLVSFTEHGTPDFRAGDEVAALAVYPEGHPGRKLGFAPGGQPGWQPTPSGQIYTIHFWAYPLSAVPAKWLLRIVGGNEWAALHVTNLLWLTVAITAVLFLCRRPLGERVAFGLLATGPWVIVYLWYPGTEIYSWSLLMMALVAVGNTRYVLASALIGLSGVQNPVSLALALVPFAAAVSDHKWWRAVACVPAGAIGLLPFAFNYAKYGKATLLSGYTDTALITWGRTVSLLTDLNQGLLAFLPVLLLAGVAAMSVTLIRRKLVPLSATVAVAVMVAGVQIQMNWNSDGVGMMRYLVWMVPPLAWLVAITWTGWFRWVVVVMAIVVHFALVAFDPRASGYLHQRELARWVLTHAPRLYNPDFELFTERQYRTELYHPRGIMILPCAFADSDGNVTKILVDRETRHRMVEVYEVDPQILPTLLDAADCERMTYIHPPAGSVRLRPNGHLAPPPR